MAEVDEAGGRLREDLADAMLETQHASGEFIFIYLYLKTFQIALLYQ